MADDPRLGRTGWARFKEECSITGAGASVSESGTTLTLTLPITSSSSFAGNQAIFLAARSNTAKSTWQPVASVSVP